MAPMARGEAVLGLALTEPGSGSDAKAMRSTARRDGDEWVLNGEKTGVSLMMAADALVLFAKTAPDAGARGVSAFLVPTALPGVSRTPLVDMGSRGIQRGSIFMDEVRLPADYLLGDQNKGFYQVMQGFDFSRSIIGLMCLGAAEVTLDETMAYVKERQAFGRPLAQFEGVSFPIAEHATLIEAAKWLCYRGLWLKDAGLPHTKEAAMAKYLAPKAAVDAIHECLLLARPLRLYAGAADRAAAARRDRPGDRRRHGAGLQDHHRPRVDGPRVATLLTGAPASHRLDMDADLHHTLVGA